MQVFGESLALEAVAQAREAEAQGFDGVVAVDHFYSGRPPGEPRWRVEALVALGAAAAATHRITLAAMVLNANFHHPAVIAHAMASLDQLSGGRAELGLGAGWYAPEHLAFGLPWGTAAERTSRLLESAAICRTMLENRGIVAHRGTHFNVETSVAWEWTDHGRPVPVTIGGSSENLLCRAAEVANRVDLLSASVQARPVVDAEHARPYERVERLIEAVRSRASASGNPIKVSATLTAVVVPPAEGLSARKGIAGWVRSSPALLEQDLLYVVGAQDDLLSKIRLLGALGVDRIHVIPGRPQPERTVAAVREMVQDIQRSPVASSGV